MHEFAPSRRGIFTTEFEDDDEDYEVYYYFPTQNRLDMGPRASSDAGDGVASIGSSFEVSDTQDSIASLSSLEHLQKLPQAPSPLSVDLPPELALPAQVADRHIEGFGYSKLFRKGLWAQSRRFTRRLDAFLAKAVASLRSLKRRLTRRTS